MANEVAKVSEDQAGSMLDSIYTKVLDGLPGMSDPIAQFAQEYLKENDSIDKAIDSLVRWQVAKCGTSGFLTGLGGLITLPVAIPVNLSSVLYVQMRMIAAIAHMNGHDITEDRVKTMVYMCLVGQSVEDIAKQVGVRIGNQVAMNVVKNIPGKVLIEINKKIGFRLLTKAGEKGIINIVKLVPLIGGIIGGTIDSASTYAIAKAAKIAFAKD